MMGLRVLHDREADRAVVYNSTYESALSPVIMGRDGLDAGEVAEMFIDFITGTGRERDKEWVSLRYGTFQVEFPRLLAEKMEDEYGDSHDDT